MLAEAVTDIAITDGALIAAALAIHTADRYLFRTGTVERLTRAARILSGTDGESLPPLREPLKLAKAIGGLVRAAWRDDRPGALPRWSRVALVCGFVVPILGPVDELAGIVTLAILAARRCHRETVAAAWQAAAIRPGC